MKSAVVPEGHKIYFASFKMDHATVAKYRIFVIDSVVVGEDELVCAHGGKEHLHVGVKACFGQVRLPVVPAELQICLSELE